MNASSRNRVSLVTILVLFGTLSAACGGPEARKAKALEAGQAYLEAGNLDKARVELRNVLQIDPNDAEARYLSGVISERLENIRQAAGHYSSAIDIDAKHVKARAGLARIHVMAGLPNEAIGIVEEGLDAQEPRAALLAVRGAAYAQLGELELAEADALAALEDDPEHEQSIALLAGVLTRQQSFDEAAAVLDRGIAALPATVDLRIARALMAEKAGDPDAAADMYAAVIEQNPGDIRYRYQLAALLQRQDRPADAERILREARDLAEDEVEATIRLVAFLEREFGADAAEAELVRMRGLPEQAARGGLLLGDFYQRQGDRDKAREVYREVAGTARGRPEELTAKTRLGALLIDEGRREEGVALLEEVLAENSRDAGALRARGSLALREGRPDDAIVDFRVLLRDDPESVANHLGLAQAHMMKGETTLGEEALRNAVRAEPNNLDTRVQLARFLARSGQVDPADDLIATVLVREPGHVAAREAAFRIAASRTDWPAAADRALALIDVAPDEPIGHYLLGIAREGLGIEDDAVAAYEKALSLRPDSAEPLAAWSRILLRRGEHAAVVERLLPLREESPDNALLANLLGEVYAATNRDEDARRILEEAIDAQPDWWLPYRTLARVVSEDDPRAAVTALERGFEATGHATELGIELAQRYEEAGETDKAIAVYESMLQTNAGSQLLANNLAMLLANYRDDESSLQRALELTRTFSSTDNASFLNTFGWVRLKSGQARAALPVLEQAVKMKPESAIMRYHLGMAWMQNGNAEAAEKELSRALEIRSSFPGADEAREVLAILSSQAAANDAG